MRAKLSTRYSSLKSLFNFFKVLLNVLNVPREVVALQLEAVRSRKLLEAVGQRGMDFKNRKL